MKRNHIFRLLAVTCLLALAGGGCSQRAKTHYNLSQADAFFDSGQLDKAETEYLNGLKADPRNPKAIGRLGVIYYDEGRFQKAAPYLYN